MTRGNPAARAYVNANSSRPVMEEVRNGTLGFTPAIVRLTGDDAANALGAVPRERLLWRTLRRAIGVPQHNPRLVSRYFVPTEVVAAALVGPDPLWVSADPHHAPTRWLGGRTQRWLAREGSACVATGQGGAGRW